MQQPLSVSLPSSIHIVDHPLLAHKLSLLRDLRTKPKQFRELINEIASLLGFVATYNLDLVKTKQLESPVNVYQGVKLKERVGLFPILRAGLGLVDSFLMLIPSAKVHHLGIYREKSTFSPVEYYNKLPDTCDIDIGFVLDPMIATAGTANAAISMLKDWGLKKIVVVCIIASLDGVLTVVNEHTNVEVVVACVDEKLTDKAYIDPGLGDAGDRLFKTFGNHE